MPDERNTLIFSGLCLVHVNPGPNGTKQAAAYLLTVAGHCARLIFPMAALTDDHEFPNGAPTVLDIPGVPLHLSVDISGVRVTFDAPAGNVEAHRGGHPQKPTQNPQWEDLDYALDLAFISGTNSLDADVLRRVAGAEIVLPAGKLSAGQPLDQGMRDQCWTLRSPRAGSSPRDQGLSDRVTFHFNGSSPGVRTVSFDDFSQNPKGHVVLAGDSPIGVSSLCGFHDGTLGMPDVTEYSRCLPTSAKVLIPGFCGPPSANATHCPPALFLDAGATS
jgi:hypothetical protein